MLVSYGTPEVLPYPLDIYLQAARDMETEIAILVGKRISPHANIMRGVHYFQVCRWPTDVPT